MPGQGGVYGTPGGGVKALGYRDCAVRGTTGHQSWLGLAEEWDP